MKFPDESKRLISLLSLLGAKTIPSELTAKPACCDNLFSIVVVVLSSKFPAESYFHIFVLSKIHMFPKLSTVRVPPLSRRVKVFSNVPEVS